MVQKIKEGQALHVAFKDIRFFPSYLSRMLKIGMQTGKLEACLKSIRHHYRFLIEQKISKIIAYLEPGGLILMGGMMLWIVSAVFIPLYEQLTVLDL